MGPLRHPGCQDFLQVWMRQRLSGICVTCIGFETVHGLMVKMGESIFQVSPQNPRASEKRDTHYANPENVHGSASYSMVGLIDVRCNPAGPDGVSLR